MIAQAIAAFIANHDQHPEIAFDIEEDFCGKPSILQDEAGFKIELKHSSTDKRLAVDADFGKLVRHHHHDDDVCHATYAPTQLAKAIAANINRDFEMTEQIVMASPLHKIHTAQDKRPIDIIRQ